MHYGMGSHYPFDIRRINKLLIKFEGKIFCVAGKLRDMTTVHHFFRNFQLCLLYFIFFFVFLNLPLRHLVPKDCNVRTNKKYMIHNAKLLLWMSTSNRPVVSWLISDQLAQFMLIGFGAMFNDFSHNLLTELPFKICICING